jgi:hypothetical protein
MTDARPELPVDESPRGQVIDAHLHLLDRQVVDPSDVPITTVDDVQLDGVEPGASPRIVALLSGAPLWTRIFGGRPRRHHLEEEPWSDVTDVDVVFRVAKPADEYEASWPERWARSEVIGRIPGGRHAPD